LNRLSIGSGTVSGMNPEQQDLRRQGLVELVAAAGLAAVEIEDPGLVP
jgi:hypothetical protein